MQSKSKPKTNVSKEREIPNIFYYYIHSKIWEKSRGYSIPKKEVKSYLAEWRIPKNIRPLILKELIILGLIDNDKRHKVIIRRPNFDEDSINKFYIKLKIY